MGSIKYKGQPLTVSEANELENQLLFKFAYDKKRDLGDYYFMTDLGYAPESLIRRVRSPGMPLEIRWSYKLPA